jgi:polyferredoxin
MNPVLILPFTGLLLLGAHSLRTGAVWETGMWLGFAALLFSVRAWARILLIPVLAAGTLLWTGLAVDLVSIRIGLGREWIRLAVIMAGTGLVIAGGVFSLLSERAAIRYSGQKNTALPQAALFVSSAALLWIARAGAPFPVLLADRFLPGSGVLEIFFLALYAAWLGGRFLGSPQSTSTLRSRIWTLFTVVFFGQLMLGLAGIPEFLMTGRLHLPIPALILAGPLYRGEGFFMPILFASTLLLVGPAWCSHLCYVGAWDDRMARRRKKAGMPSKTHRTALLRWSILAGTILLPVLLSRFDAPLGMVVAIPVLFGTLSVAVMLFLSGKRGIMMHCTAICPMGLIANLWGRFSPWKVRIDSGCTGCGRCSRVCRYGALSPSDLARNTPGPTCTLCGDCLPSCPHDRIGYAFPGLTRSRARSVFLVAVLTLHTAFLGVARM